MTENKPTRHPPILIEPDSDDEGPRKRQRVDEGSTTDHRLAILQAALMLVVAAERHTDQDLTLCVASSHRISSLCGDPTVFIAPSISKLIAGQPEPDHTSSRRPPTPPFSTEFRSIMFPSRHQVDLSPKGTINAVLNPMLTCAPTTNPVTATASTLPSGRPLLAPPQLPHVKCGERVAKPSLKQGNPV